MRTPSSPPVSRRQFVGQLSAAGALALAPRVLRAENAPARRLGIALVGLGSYSTGQLGPALKQTNRISTSDAASGWPSMREANAAARATLAC